MDAVALTILLIVALAISAVVYMHRLDLETRHEPPRESAGIATDGSESDGKPQGPESAQ